MEDESNIQALPAPVTEAIRDLSRRCGLKRVRLFGSRARGDNRERSDIDLAVSGGNVAEFSCDVDYDTPTLLQFDVVDLDKPVNPALLASIDRDGIDLYVG